MDDPRVGTVVDGRYSILERLAAGGSGVVYRGERVGLAKPVAIKFLHRSSVMMAERTTRFRREAEVMSRLAHPNLMSIIDFGEVDDVPYLVMEFLAGASLREALERGALDPRRAVYIAYQILAGLASAHDSGVLHRDLKPGNVLLVGGPGEDLVKILDFGVAKLLDTEGPTEVSAVAGRVIGTPAYMAPEQARSRPADPRTDVYAVGIMLYEMVVGRRPFDGDNDLAVLRQQVEDEPVPPRALRSDISRELDAVILRALAKEPDDRWSSAHELSAALLELPEGSGVLRLRPDMGTQDDADETAPPEVVSRSRWRVALVIGLALVVACGGVLAASYYGYIDVPGTPWQRSAAPADAGPSDAAPADAGVADALPADAGPPPIHAEIRPYVGFLANPQASPVDYLVGLFEDHDVVVLCLRRPAETTQYELVAELVRDPRFVERAGHVITDAGTRAVRKRVAELTRGDAVTDEQLLRLYRELGIERPNPNLGALLRTVAARNAELPADRRVQVHPGGDRIARAVRDLERGARPLVLASDCDATRAIGGAVAHVLLNQTRGLVPTAGGRWDAAFERVGNPTVGFDLADSPFGRDRIDAATDAGTETYAERFTGLVFYRALRDHRMISGIPDLFGDGHARVIDRRRRRAHEPPLTDEQRTALETRRIETYAETDPIQWAIAQRQIASWLEVGD